MPDQYRREHEHERDTGSGRGTSRDERTGGDWQQRGDEDSPGYRSQARESDREWQGEPDWELDRPRGWHGGREGTPSSPEPWRGSQSPHSQWGGSQEPWRGARDLGAPGRAREDWGEQDLRGGWRQREPDWRGGRFREREQERFGTGGNREYEQDWGHRVERGREGGSSRGGGWPSGGGGGPVSTWGSESSRGSRDTREGAWPDYAGRGPKGYKRSDARIREEVSDRLMDDHDVDASDITVDVKEGEVTLAGTVQSRDQKRRAEELAERVSGVSDVTNHLRVNRQAGGHAGQAMAPPEGGQIPPGARAGQPSSQAGQASQPPATGQPDPPRQGLQTGGSRSIRTTATNT